jgi:hypothetical protein
MPNPARQARTHGEGSAALAPHELGLAATFGGIVFGQAGPEKAVKVLPNETNRSKVLEG